ncbi:MAG: DEAD/DEAH box helicase [Proteobacteria bacterium]|nr:DEAD/DEAH box helicase [Pseudomonadota bacterium]
MINSDPQVDTISTETLEQTTSNSQAQAAPLPFSSLVPDADIVEALTVKGITTPTPVQAAVLPEAMTGIDMIVQAQTGSGKTLAFGLPLVQRIRREGIRYGTFGLIITPTRELAIQVKEVIASLTPEIKPACIIGGASTKAQIQGMREDNRIVVGTPGRILDLIEQREILLRKCGYFVLDEADEMLSMGFYEDVRAILSRLPTKRQGIFTSATITPRVQNLAHSFLSNPKTVAITSSTATAAEIEHLYCEVEGDLAAKAVALCDIIETRNPRSAIIFCNTKSDTELVEVYLRRRGFDARKINSDLSQTERERIMRSVRMGTLRLLIATDVAARGIDIEKIDLVVNYAIHDTAETYVHRTGRTGRAGRKGTAISLVGPQDFGPFLNLKRGLSYEIKKIDLPTEKDVHDAKIAHFHELLEAADMVITDRDLALGKTLLKEIAGMADQEKAAEVMAKFYRIVLHSAIKHTPEQEADGQATPTSSAAPSDTSAPSHEEAHQHHDSSEHGRSRRDQREARYEERPRQDRYNDRRSDRGHSRGGSNRGGRSRGGGRGRN